MKKYSKDGCKHKVLVLKGENELGKWYDCVNCKTTKLKLTKETKK